MSWKAFLTVVFLLNGLFLGGVSANEFLNHDYNMPSVLMAIVAIFCLAASFGLIVGSIPK